MSAKIELTAATPENFNLLGIYDECYDLYERIMDYCDQVIEENTNPNTGMCTIGTEGLRKRSSAKVKKLLNAFFKEHCYIFTTEYQILYTNSKALRNCDFVYCDMSVADDHRGFKYIYKHQPIKKFIAGLELIAARIIANRKEREGQKVPVESILKEVDFRIKMLASQAWAERKVNLDEANLPFECSQLHVFKALHRISCVRNHHEVKPDVCIIPIVGSGKTAVRVPVHVCEKCKKKFIGYESYKLFCGEYGNLLFERSWDEDFEDDFFGRFKAESKLHRMGYNVVDGLLTEKERRNLLKMLIDQNLMKYHEICSDIEKAIRLFDGRKEYIIAVDKWRKDLAFLGNYVTEGM